MREDIAKTSSNFDCRPPHCAKDKMPSEPLVPEAACSESGVC